MSKTVLHSEMSSTDQSLVKAARIALGFALAGMENRLYKASIQLSTVSIDRHADFADVKFNGHKITVYFTTAIMLRIQKAVVHKDTGVNRYVEYDVTVDFTVTGNDWPVLAIHQSLLDESLFYLQQALVKQFGSKKALEYILGLKEIPAVMRNPVPPIKDINMAWVIFYFDPSSTIKCARVSWLLGEMLADCVSVTLELKTSGRTEWTHMVVDMS